MRTRLRLYLRIASYVALLIPGALPAQELRAAQDTISKLAALDARLVAMSERLQVIWPGYDFASLGLLYVVPGIAKAVVRWPETPPAGMTALPGAPGFFYTGTQSISWRPGLAVAPAIVLRGTNEAQLLGLGIHEAFHAYEVTRRQNGRKFGWGENAMVTSGYPLMDFDNEALFALESRLLLRAVNAKTIAQARTLAGEFLGVRQRRHARLDSTFVNFERAAELHEGMAQYALLRGLREVAGAHPQYAAAIAQEYKTEGSVLERTLESSTAVRRRFYATGAHLGMLLDRLSPEWKEQLLRDDLWVEDMLLRTAPARALSRAAEEELPALTLQAVRAVDALRARRLALRDSLLARPGVRIVIQPSALPRGRADWCNFDPQNLLPTGTGQNLHTRTLRICSGNETLADFELPVVEDELTGTLTTVAEAAALRITAAEGEVTLPPRGESVRVNQLRITANGIAITMRTAILIGGDNRLLVVPLGR